MQESSEFRDSSEVDSVGRTSSESNEESFSDSEALQTEWSSDDSVEQYSTDVNDTQRKRPRAGGWGKSRSNA